MTIDTTTIRLWLTIYKDEWKSDKSKFAEGIIFACNHFLKLVANYEELEGNKIVKERNEK